MAEDEKPKEAMKNLHVEVPVDFHRRLKVLCAIKGTSMKGYALEAIKEKVQRDDEAIAAGRGE